MHQAPMIPMISLCRIFWVLLWYLRGPTLWCISVSSISYRIHLHHCRTTFFMKSHHQHPHSSTIFVSLNPIPSISISTTSITNLIHATNSSTCSLHPTVIPPKTGCSSLYVTHSSSLCPSYILIPIEIKPHNTFNLNLLIFKKNTFLFCFSFTLNISQTTN